MCKLSNSIVSVNRLFEKIDGATYTYPNTLNPNTAYTYITVPTSSSSTYSISIQSISGKTKYSWLAAFFGIYIDNTRYDNYAYGLRYDLGPYTCNLSNLQGGNNLYFKLVNETANQYLEEVTVTHSDIIINETMNISKPSGDSVLYREVVGLGKGCGITIFGYHTDGERIDHESGKPEGDVFDYIRKHTFGNGTQLSTNQEYTMQSDGYVKGTGYIYNGGGYFTIGSIEHSITGGNFGSGYHPTIYLKAYKGEVVKLLYTLNVYLYVYEQTD